MAAGQQVDQYNRQLHTAEIQFIKKSIKAYADKLGISEDAAERLLSRGAAFDADSDWREAYSKYTPDEIQQLIAANTWLASEAQKAGLEFRNEKGDLQAAFTTKPEQFNNHDLFLHQSFSDEDYKQSVLLSADERAKVDNQVVTAGAAVLGTFKGKVTGSGEALVDTYNTAKVLLDPETWNQLGEAGQRGWELYQNDPEQFNTLLRSIPGEAAANLKKELETFAYKTELLGGQGQEYAQAEHVASGLAREGIGQINPFKKLGDAVNVLQIIGKKIPDGNSKSNSNSSSNQELGSNQRDGVNSGGGVGAANTGVVTTVPTSGRKFNQLTSRGWNQSSIDDVVNNSVHTSPAVNRVTGNQATAYFDSTGNYIVRDNVTGDLVQTSNRNDPNWIPDATISNPYVPD